MPEPPRAGLEAFARAYRERRCTPEQVARRFLAGLASSEARRPSLRFFISQSPDDLLGQARRSAERFAHGQALGPLDGVPVAVKDELDQAGYPTTVGTCFLGGSPVAEDAAAVSRLRRAGALLVGKANMQEIGLGVTGINPQHGAARNPWAPDRMTGGSSSGSAAVVASGLCAGALGADAGGSVRIPAALCGVVGLKPTYGRVSEVGAAPLCWSLAHIGPFAASVRDAATLLATIAGPDPRDRNTLGQPALALGASADGVAGLRIGWCPAWSAQATPEVLAVCQGAVERLVEAGAELVEVAIEHLELVRAVQYVTIGVEMAASQHEHRLERKRDYAADTRMLLELASQLPAVDYVRAQRLRTLVARSFDAVLAGVDALITPATACTALPIREDALKAGENDNAALEQLTAFSFAANLTGLPAISVPAGHDSGGLPVGLQIIGRHWDEAMILRLARAVEAAAPPRTPAVHYDLLAG